MILARKSSEGRPPLHQQMTPTRRTTNREQEEDDEEENLEEENVNDSQVMINVESQEEQKETNQNVVVHSSQNLDRKSGRPSTIYNQFDMSPRSINLRLDSVSDSSPGKKRHRFEVTQNAISARVNPSDIRITQELIDQMV